MFLFLSTADFWGWLNKLHLQDNGQKRSQNFLLNAKALYIILHKHSPKCVEYLCMQYWISLLYTAWHHHLFSFLSVLLFTFPFPGICRNRLPELSDGYEHKLFAFQRLKMDSLLEIPAAVVYQRFYYFGNSAAPFAWATFLLQNFSWDQPECAFKYLEWKEAGMYRKSTYPQFVSSMLEFINLSGNSC